MSASSERTAEYERRFRRAGLPMFVEGFSASTDVFNRAIPLLGFIFLAELLGAGQLDWTWWQNVLAVLGGVVVIVLGAGVLNVAQSDARSPRSRSGSGRPSSPAS